MKKKRLFGVIIGSVLLLMVLIVVRERYTNPMPIPSAKVPPVVFSSSNVS